MLPILQFLWVSHVIFLRLSSGVASARFVFSIIFGNAAASFFETLDLDNPVEVDKALILKGPLLFRFVGQVIRLIGSHY
jgi:hypothetical protein